MVKLEELEDEHFINRPDATSDGALLVDDDDDYTDTDSEISDDGSEAAIDETLLDRLTALRDIIPPKARARISSVSSSLYSATSTTVNYSGKGLWVLATSILLLGIPYALAFSDEQQFLEEERRAGQMSEGAQGMLQPGAVEGQQAQARAAL